MPYMSPLHGEVISDKGILGPSYLSRARRETVNFQAALVAGRDAGTVKDESIWVEIGAHPICSKMIKAALGSHIHALPSLRRNEDAWKVLAKSLSSLYLAGLDIQWKEYHRDFKHALRYSNDFCLTKGDEKSAAISAALVSANSMLSTSSVQRVLEQQLGDEKSTLVIESNLHHPSLSGVIQGHKVNGASLCPSSLYADIALTVADYLLQAAKTDTKGIGMDVSDMTVNKPLIATGNGPQLVRASASADWNARRVLIDFYSVTGDGNKTANHANCTVDFENTDGWLKEWRRNAYLIRSRIDSLEQGVEQGQVKRGLAYKLFGALVDYGQCYQGMQEVTLDSAQLDALCKYQNLLASGRNCFSPVAFWKIHVTRRRSSFT
ncbi:hypothetical protein HO173_006068 [Letharia columbiana]|uniref:PKS/mFAS DH domain-containing protein n=1 Tax=Letharia columbiana TaxID=112416 RepID=A0A8H6FWB6_9LECA|nr:uncharacterized protein HO173_006068 [Letharia columbiana]KAF6235872.1 hypothetical protein HO173_006068 [Letharia columbiana]